MQWLALIWMPKDRQVCDQHCNGAVGCAVIIFTRCLQQQLVSVWWRWRHPVTLLLRSSLQPGTVPQCNIILKLVTSKRDRLVMCV